MMNDAYRHDHAFTFVARYFGRSYFPMSTLHRPLQSFQVNQIRPVIPGVASYGNSLPQGSAHSLVSGKTVATVTVSQVRNQVTQVV
jgi:hypothetical protein